MSLPYTWDNTAEKVAQDLATHIADRIVLVTGVSPGGLGAAFASAIAHQKPRLIILAARSVSKAEETAKAIAEQAPDVQTRLLELDLSSQAQIRQAAAEVNAYAENIDVLVNNAGVMAIPYTPTTDGLESQFGINYLGPFLFTNLIMPKLRAGAGKARVVNISSDGYRASAIRFADPNFDNGKAYDKWEAYGQSKTATMLFAIALAKRLGDELVAVSIHPGVIFTNLANHFVTDIVEELTQLAHRQGNGPFADGGRFKNLPQGVSTHVVAAFDPRIEEHNGAYLSDCQVLPPDQIRCWGRDPVEAEKLWELSEEMVGQKFEY
ncbi:hypothetical protein ASPZODRAFT_129039 [Penicilliopsis zonata CBS 506.65]|uniref:Uncharacterized protein n=1 Tax=Penicilliopsis zonata CBS 506.65 TaxID=1073090 RepID=A0A1L9STK8_9EURO|nr:hypothetical protein ASPZODRAFT_129039 [Penicilliopsis zonata CBS 506.65]OJJ50413.1 hypothetical protein ASPZODRAFT_129039 [Penicilliopsis zonata CBS 506.65]